MSDHLLNATELMDVLGISHATFYRKKKEYERLFQVKQPVGHRRFSRYIVERYLRMESPARFGKGRRSA